MSDERQRVRTTSAIWLLIGIIFGAAATGGLILALSVWLRGEGPVVALGPPRYVEELAAGLGHTYQGEFHFFVGGGAAVFDCDQDLKPDVFIAGGENQAGLYENRSVPGESIRFSRQVSPVTDLVDVTGAYPVDVDSDGFVDIAVLRLGENVMLRGRGDCTFERANELWGIDGGDDWTVAFSATWQVGDAMPTLAFGNYLRLSEGGERDECEDHRLFEPVDSGYGTPRALSPGYCTLSILFSDWSRSGSADLRMTNDRHYYVGGHEQLWNLADSPPREFTSSDGWEELQIWGMGIASQDIDGDSLPEIFLTSQGDNKFQTLAGDADRPEYTDIALAANATAHRPFSGDTLRPSTAWHAEFDDVNNDGLFDLFVTKGNVEAQEDFAVEDPNNLMIGQPNGTFEEGAEAAGLIDYSRSRGGAVADFDQDGLLDVLVVERREPVRIWRNVGQVSGEQSGNWIQLHIGQPGPNRFAVGAWIEIRSGSLGSTREVTVGGGHASGDLGWTHFGLGPYDEAEARVVWPDGATSDWVRLEANDRFMWERGSPPLRFDPPRD